jgi:hypothetical protein
MKFPNYLTSTLAVVGAFSLIIMACSANDNNSATTTTNSVGKYQIATGNASGYQFYVVDTETGIVKLYSKDASVTNSVHVLKETILTQP